jgi:hypothetical protein
MSKATGQDLLLHDPFNPDNEDGLIKDGGYYTITLGLNGITSTEVDHCENGGWREKMQRQGGDNNEEESVECRV